MSVRQPISAFAGFMILVSVALTLWVSPLFVWMTVFIGANLLQSAFTGFCPAAKVINRLGIKPGCAMNSPAESPTPKE